MSDTPETPEAPRPITVKDVYDLVKVEALDLFAKKARPDMSKTNEQRLWDRCVKLAGARVKRRVERLLKKQAATASPADSSLSVSPSPAPQEP